MKIVQILYPGLGGHTSVAFSLIEGDKIKQNSYSLIGYGIEKPAETFVIKAKENEVEYRSIIKSKGIALNSQRMVYKHLQQFRPDAIIMHSTATVFAVFLYSIFNKVKWISVEHQSNFAKSKKDWLYTFFILTLCPLIIYLSEDYREQVKNKMKIIVPLRHIHVIPNGINIEKYSQALEKKLDPNEIRIAMISRFNNLRDHETLIKAVNELIPKYPIKLIFAGDGHSREQMESLVKNMHLETKVEFLGLISENEIINLLKTVNIYVHSSLAETQSTSILQVMATKTPIIATDIPGINNVIDNQIDGLLFSVGDFHQLSKLILNVVNLKNDELEILTENALQKIYDNYSTEKMYKSYLNLIKTYVRS